MIIALHSLGAKVPEKTWPLIFLELPKILEKQLPTLRFIYSHPPTELLYSIKCKITDRIVIF